MARREARPIIFVCAVISHEGELVIDSIVASKQEEAISIFKEKYCIAPSSILGPFYRKKTQVINNTTSMKFTNTIKKAEYNGWLVNAIFLSDPENQAYLVFIKRIDNKKITPPQGTVIVPILNLRIIENVE